MVPALFMFAAASVGVSAWAGYGFRWYLIFLGASRHLFQSSRLARRTRVRHHLFEMVGSAAQPRSVLSYGSHR
jgi:hypothetical protein